MRGPGFDLLAMGRSSIDLYSNDIGSPFSEIKSFAAYVGGCPTNIAVGAQRLGLRSALLTAVGEDPVGDFVLAFLEKEGVETAFIPRKAGRSTAAVLLGIEPPDRFPLVFYRDNCADIELTRDDVRNAPVADSRAVLLTGTGLTAEPSRSATIFAAQQAKAAGATVFLDIDYRAALWPDASRFAEALLAVLPFVDVAIGTEEEVLAMSGGRRTADTSAAARSTLTIGPQALVLKWGASGARVFLSADETIDATPFPVEVCNVLGAGDAFAAGFIYGRLEGWDWYRSARMGNACGAIVVTRHGCANFMPYRDEALEFIDARGGF